MAEIEGRQLSKQLRNVSWPIQKKKLISVNWTSLSSFMSSTVLVWVCQVIYCIWSPLDKVIWLFLYFHKKRCDSSQSTPIRKKRAKVINKENRISISYSYKKYWIYVILQYMLYLYFFMRWIMINIFSEQNPALKNLWLSTSNECQNLNSESKNSVTPSSSI